MLGHEDECDQCELMSAGSSPDTLAQPGLPRVGLKERTTLIAREGQFVYVAGLVDVFDSFAMWLDVGHPLSSRHTIYVL